MGTILVVDDSPTIRSQIKQALASEQMFDRFLEAGDGLAAYKSLVENRPDLVICDLVMPDFDGFKFLMLRAAHAELASTPVIMLTAEGDAERKVELLDRGAVDYVTKPFHSRELLARVRNQYNLKILQDQLTAANARLEALSSTDALTGLFNRRHFDEALTKEVARSVRYRTALGVILIDIDHFKDVNDNHGHAMGDEVLRNLGRLVAAGVRSMDVAARIGGEELAIVLPHTTLVGALELAERLRKEIETATHTIGEIALRKTASFGVAAYEGTGSPMSAADLLRHSDEALYQAKRAGRNRVVAWAALKDDEPAAV